MEIYLLATKSLHSFETPNSQKDQKVNDIVLIQNRVNLKFLGNLRRIIEVNKGRDGLVRSCVFKTKKGNLRRPSLYILLKLLIN